MYEPTSEGNRGLNPAIPLVLVGGGTTAGDGLFVYPGRAGPVSGARLENWRDGSEDAELFLRLPLARRQELVHTVVRSIGEWSEDAALVEKVRRAAAKAGMADEYERRQAART